MSDFEVHPVGTGQRLAGCCTNDCNQGRRCPVRGAALVLLDEAAKMRDVGDIGARQLERDAREILRAQTADAPPALAEVQIEPDYWSRGHFYEGHRKCLRVVGDLEPLPVGTKLVPVGSRP